MKKTLKLGAKLAAMLGATLLALVTPSITAARDETPIKIANGDAVKGVQTVAIGAFTVGFIFESVDQTAATGGMIGAFGGATKAKSELVGVTPEMMQTVVDGAYADFVAQLGAAGYAVAPAATMFADGALAKAKPATAPLDISIALEKGSKGKAVYLKPSALPQLLLMPGDFTGSGFSSMGLNMNAAMNAAVLTNYARTAQTGVIDVVYLIDFSNQKRPGAFSFGGLDVNAGLSVASGYSRASLIAPSGKQSVLTFRQPVVVEGDFITKEDKTSGASKTAQTVANVGGGVAAAMGFGGLRFGKTRKFAFTAKPGNYETGATKAATLANSQLIAQLTALR